MFAFGEPKQKQRNRRNQTGRGGNGKASEILFAIAIDCLVIGRRGVEARQTQRAAREVDKRDNPTRARELLQHDAVNHQRGSKPERDNISERIELATKRTLMPAQACKASIQKIKDERAENKPDGGVKKITSRIWIGRLEQCPLKNFERGREPAKQIPRRH